MANVKAEKLTEEIMRGVETEIKGILEKVEKCARKGETPSLESIEFVSRRLLLGKAREVVEKAVSLLGTGYSGRFIKCECGGLLESKGNRDKYVKTILGEISVKRAYYHCKDCGKGVFPLEKGLGIGGGHASPALRRAVSLAGVQGSFYGAPVLLREIGEIKVSRVEVRRITEEVAISAEEALKSQAVLPPLEKTDRAYISCDGAMVNTTNGWREIKVGAIYNDAREQKRYVSLIGKADKFGSVLRKTGMATGVWKCPEAIFIGDGAQWIRNQARINFPQASQIVDFYHVKEHITECAKKVFGEGTKKAKLWRKRCISAIYTGGPGKTISLLVEKEVIRRKAVKGLLRYVRSNAERMRYPQYRAKGWKIGSGPVESACKQIVSQRLKLNAGMRWRVENADAIARLRCIWLSNAWNAFWRKVSAA